MRPNIAHALNNATSNILGSTADQSMRTIYLFGGIDEAAAYRFVVAFRVMDSVPGPITVLLSSHGGDIECGLAIFDCIKNARNPVTIVGYGSVQSMGAIIMQAGDTRLLMPEARFMIHSGVITIPDETNAERFLAISTEMKSIKERLTGILQERCRADTNVPAMMERETFMSAADALHAGFVDGVVVHPDRGAYEPKVKPKKKKRKSR